MDPGVVIDDNYHQRHLFKRKRRRPGKAPANVGRIVDRGRFIEIGEVAAQLGISKISVRNSVKAGRLPFTLTRNKQVRGRGHPLSIVPAREWNHFVAQIREHGWPLTLRHIATPVEFLMTTDEVKRAELTVAEVAPDPHTAG